MSHTFFISYILQVEHRGTQPTGWEAAAASALEPESPSLSFLWAQLDETGNQNTSAHQSTPNAAAASELQLPLQLHEADQHQTENDSELPELQ